ncbi:MAG: HAD-IC family P-type ATPase [Parvularculaceae bacterium]
MRARRVGEETMLGRIEAITRHGQRSRAAAGEKLDRPITLFIPLTILLAMLVFAAWWRLGPAPAAALGLVNAICVLVVACPDALRYAAPAPIMVAMGRATRSGLLFRDAKSLEALAGASLVVVNKSGVLTEGRLRLMVVEAASGFTETEVLAAAAAAEARSDHPIARAIVHGARARGVAVPKSVKHRALAGEGVFAVAAGGARVAVGNLKMMSRLGDRAKPLPGAGDRHRMKGRTIVFVSINGKRAGLVGVADPIKPRASETVAALRAAGLKVMMLTGDNRKTAQAIADELGIDDIRAEVSGKDKPRLIGELQKSGINVAMVSDAPEQGNGDAPALAMASVGVALTAGTALSLPKTGLAVLSGDLSGLVRARRLSLATMAIIRQNVRVALGFSGLGVTLAAGVLYPAGFLLSPITAAAAMSLVSAVPLANALRLRRVKL